MIKRAAFLLCLAVPLLAIDWANPASMDPTSVEPADVFTANPDSLHMLAREAYNKKNYMEAARYYLAVAHYQSDNVTAIYNLACCYRLVGDEERTVAFLNAAWERGFADLEHIKKDPDFKKVRKSEAFKELVAKFEEEVKAKKEEWAGVEQLSFRTQTIQLASLIYPADYDSTRSYPLLVFLHGRGGSAQNSLHLFADVKGLEQSEEIAAKLSSYFICVPDAPYPLDIGTEVGHSWVIEAAPDGETRRLSFERSADLVMDMLDDLLARYPIDTTTVYLFGFSQGAGLTYMAGLAHPDRFAGIASFGGWLDDKLTDEVLEQAKDLQVFIAHGTKDRSVPYKLGKKAYKRLEKHGYDVTLETFEGGHFIHPEKFLAMLEWMEGKQGD